MRSYSILIGVLLLVFSVGQSKIFSMSSLFEQQKKKNLQGCLQSDENQECSKCKKGYTLLSNICLKPSIKFINPENQINFTPCEQQQSCGKVKLFSNSSQFYQFTQKFLKKLPLSQSSKSIQTFQRNFTLRSSQNQISKYNIEERENSERVLQQNLSKTDGSYLYIVDGNKIKIVIGYPYDKIRPVSILEPKLEIAQIEIMNNLLAVIGRSASSNETICKIYDISNKLSPYVAKQLRISGSYLTSKLTENGDLIILNGFQVLNNKIELWYDFGKGKTDVTPKQIYWYPEFEYSNPYGISIAIINLFNEGNLKGKTISLISQNGAKIFISQKHIYIAGNVENAKQSYSNIIKVFAFSEIVKPFAQAKIVGIVKDKLAMSQQGQFMRVVTVVKGKQTEAPKTSLYCLDHYLQNYGSLVDLIPGLNSAEILFTQKRLCIALKQNDKIACVDVSDHQNPTMLQKFQIKRGSKAIKILDENHLINVSRKDRDKKLIVSIYNTQDTLNIRQTARLQIQQQYVDYVFEWERSILIKQNNLMVIPAYNPDRNNKFDGIFVFHINQNQILLKAVIDQSLGLKNRTTRKSEDRTRIEVFIINEYLIAGSNSLLKVYKIENQLSWIKDIDLSPSVQAPKPNEQNNIKSNGPKNIRPTKSATDNKS